MAAAGGAVDPNWILAGLGAIGAFLGAWRYATRYFAQRRDRQEGYERLYCDTYGWPAETDEYGNEISPARPGLLARLEALEERGSRRGSA